MQLTRIDENKCRQILDAEKRTGKKVTVAFNYRYAPTAEKLKSLLMAGTIGAVHSVDFHWYLDTSHGTDYFRRWHALRANSGTLFVHKSTHHFDLINWYLDADPLEVSSVHCGLPIEGYQLAFNGAGGRIEIRQYERQPWPVPPGQDEIRVTRNFGASEVITVQHGRGGHFGGEERLKRMLFVPGTPDPLRQRAGSRAGALSLLTGVAAVRSADSGRTVRIADLVRL